MLAPTWMNYADFIDAEIHDGVQTFKWVILGVPLIYVYETVNMTPLNRVTVSIIEEPSDTFNFGPRNLTLPANILSLPPICKLSNPANWGACQKFRG